MVSNRLQGVDIGVRTGRELAEAGELQAEGPAGVWFEEVIEGAADEAQVQDEALGAAGDALPEDGVDELGG